MPSRSVVRVAKKALRLDDEMQFIRSWIEKPISTGAVMPSGKALARTMARYVDPHASGPVIELGPGTGPVTQALVERGVDPARLILVEFNPDFCRLLRTRYPAATVVQGDAYRLRRLLETFVREPAAAVVSGLPLVTKPLRTRLRLIADAMSLLAQGAPFVQFTYAMVPPIPKALSGDQGRALRIDLAEPAAGARVGLSRTLRLARDVILVAVINGAADGHAENPRPARLDPHRLAQCQAGGAGGERTGLDRRRRHPHFARGLSAAALRGRSRSQCRTAGQRAQAQADDHGAPRRVHRQPGILSLGDADAEERHRLGLARARARRSDLCRLQAPRVRDRIGLAGPRRRACAR